jgi:hypothetical protein
MSNYKQLNQAQFKVCRLATGYHFFTEALVHQPDHLRREWRSCIPFVDKLFRHPVFWFLLPLK